MKNRSISLSSDDVEEEINEDGNAYTSLQQRTWERCEFCDELFYNRYSILRHNVSHIIIPLIKQTTHQCNECLYHFTSLEDLSTHISIKHKDVLTDNRTPVKVKRELSFEENLPEILQSIVEKQVYVKCEDELKEVFIKGNELRNNGLAQRHNDENDRQWHSKVKREDEAEIFNKSNELINKNGIAQLGNTQKDRYSTNEALNALKEEPLSPKLLLEERRSSLTDEEKESIRNRLLFEEDLEDDLFQDLSANFQDNIKPLYHKLPLDFDEQAKTLRSNQKMNFLSQHGLNIERSSSVDIIYENEKQVQENTTDLIRYAKPVHYDVLVEPKICTCRWCGKAFPNRFKLLQHEPKHLRVKKKKWQSPLCCICERYISGNYRNLRMHIENKHPQQLDLDKNYSTDKCPKCSLRYHDYKKHLRNYHEVYKCPKCDLEFETIELRNDHECGNKTVCQMEPTVLCNNNTSSGYKTAQNFEDFIESYKVETVKSVDSAVMQLCDMCFTFMKNYMQKRQNYEVIGEKSEMGVRQTCDKCNNKFFEVKLVERKPMRSREMPKPRIKHSLTNQERLKNIQHRLKMLKKK